MDNHQDFYFQLKANLCLYSIYMPEGWGILGRQVKGPNSQGVGIDYGLDIEKVAFSYHNN